MARWYRRLTQVFFLLFAVQFVLLIAASVLPTDWQLSVLMTAVACIVAASVLALVTIWLDYRSGADRSGPKDLLEAMVVGALVIVPAGILEKTHGFNWWLTALAASAIVMPLWWLYLRARHDRQ